MDYFIEKVKLNPCLWDTNHRSYRDMGKKDLAWERIARQCEMENGKEAKIQWKKIRDSHREALRRRRTSPGQAGLQLKPWKYEALMEFVLPQMEKITTISEFQDSPSTSDTSNTVTESLLTPSEAPVRASKQNRLSTDILQEREKRREQRHAERDEVRKQEIDMNRVSQDALSNLFTSLCQKTRELPKYLQLRVQREVFDSVTRAEEEAMSFQSMVTQPTYASSPSDYVPTVTKTQPYDSEDE